MLLSRFNKTGIEPMNEAVTNTNIPFQPEKLKTKTEINKIRHCLIIGLAKTSACSAKTFAKNLVIKYAMPADANAVAENR